MSVRLMMTALSGDRITLTSTINVTRAPGTPASFTVSSAGTYGGDSPTGGDSGTWLASGTNSNYTVKFHPTGGTPGTVTSGTVDSELALSSSRTWTRSAGSGQVLDVIGTLTITRVSDGFVAATATLHITDDNT